MRSQSSLSERWPVSQELLQIKQCAGRSREIVGSRAKIVASNLASPELKFQDPSAWTVIAMEAWDGDLGHFSDGRGLKISARDIFAILLGVLDAVERLHATSHMVWVDSKTTNVLYVKDSSGIRLVIGDLGGIAKAGVDTSCIPTFPCPWDPLSNAQCNERLSSWGVVCVCFCLFSRRLLKGEALLPWTMTSAKFDHCAWTFLAHKYNADRDRPNSLKGLTDTLESLYGRTYSGDADAAAIRDFLFRVFSFSIGAKFRGSTLSPDRLTFKSMREMLNEAIAVETLKTVLDDTGDWS